MLPLFKKHRFCWRNARANQCRQRCSNPINASLFSCSTSPGFGFRRLEACRSDDATEACTERGEKSSVKTKSDRSPSRNDSCMPAAPVTAVLGKTAGLALPCRSLVASVKTAVLPIVVVRGDRSNSRNRHLRDRTFSPTVANFCPLVDIKV